MKTTIFLSRDNSNTAVLSRGLGNIPTPAQFLSPQPTWLRVQPFSRSLVAQPELYIELSPTMSSCCQSISWASSSCSFPIREMTFQVLRARMQCQESSAACPALHPTSVPTGGKPTGQKLYFSPSRAPRCSPTNFPPVRLCSWIQIHCCLEITLN